jgi:hypothetical protein
MKNPARGQTTPAATGSGGISVEPDPGIGGGGNAPADASGGSGVKGGGIDDTGGGGGGTVSPSVGGMGAGPASGTRNDSGVPPPAPDKPPLVIGADTTPLGAARNAEDAGGIGAGVEVGLTGAPAGRGNGGTTLGGGGRSRFIASAIVYTTTPRPSQLSSL